MPWRPRRPPDDFTDEIRSHIVLETERLVAEGTGREEAERLARVRFGSVTVASERFYELGQITWLDNLVRDVRSAVRGLRASPAYAIAVVLTLALGIGVNAAMFSLTNGLLLRALPVKDPWQLVSLSSNRLPRGLTEAWTYAIWGQIRDRMKDRVSGSLAWSIQRRLTVATSGADREQADVVFISGGAFTTLGVDPAFGRLLRVDDDVRGDGHPPAVVISHEYWQRRFGGDRGAIGTTLFVEGVGCNVVGVAPPNFLGPEKGRTFDLALPLNAEAAIYPRNTAIDDSGYYWLWIFLRLNSGQSRDEVTTILRGVQPQIRAATALNNNVPPEFRAQYEALYLKNPFTLQDASTGTVSQVRARYGTPLATLLGIAGLVLLMACANVANLTLARAIGRKHELAVRRALGASRWRLGQQIFVENLVIAGVGGVLGLIFAVWASKALVSQLSTSVSRVAFDLSLDWHLIAFSSLGIVATALLFGTAPALLAGRVTGIDATKEHERGIVGDSRAKLSNGFVVAQIALSIVLVVAAGLFVRSFSMLATRDLGFESEHLLLVALNGQRAVADREQRVQQYRQMRTMVRELPGVTEAGLSLMTPLGNLFMVPTLEVSGSSHKEVGAANVISPGWFTTYGMPILSGRDFTESDLSNRPRVAIVNQTLVRKFLDGANPLGHTISMAFAPTAPMEIVGVVRDVVYTSIRDPVPATVFIPFAQADMGATAYMSANLNVRTRENPSGALTRRIAYVVNEVNPGVSVAFRELSEQVDASMTQDKIMAELSTLFGVLALLLAAVGLYGITAYGVSRRRTELGIRMSLGAAPAGIVRLVLIRVFVLVLIGIALGAVVSFWASKFVGSLIYGLTPRDPATLIGSAILLGVVAALASWCPAWRASRIQPADVLRES